jgi:2,4-dienoyl-CoA reductase-like NADH-dependent reductase (Old Yellow Enzyme family)
MNADALFSPFTYKSLSLKNRIVMPAMTRRHSPDGLPSQDVAEYYARRATNLGLIISEGTVIERPASKNSKDIPDFYGCALDGWRNVIGMVHNNSGTMGPQLWHVGEVKPDPTGWLPALPFEGPGNMSADDIQDTIAKFAEAAQNAKKLGFDFLEIHGAHGYLIDQFFWEHTNQRKDEYGGKTIGERTRFAVDIVKAIRKSVGPDFVISMRLSQWKIQDYEAKLAFTPKEMESWLLPLLDAGVDIFHCSQRRYWESEFGGSDLNFAGWAKKITEQPTITVGSVGLTGEFLQALYHNESSGTTDFDELIRRFERGDFDLVAVGRAILQDAMWVKKLKENRISELQDFSKDSLGVYY